MGYGCQSDYNVGHTEYHVEPMYRSSNTGNMDCNQQCCQLCWIIGETPDFEPFLPVSRLKSEISRIIAEVYYYL